MAAMDQTTWAADYAPLHFPEVAMRVVTLKPDRFPDVTCQSRELCLVAVLQDGNLLKHVKAQTPEICLVAVRQNGLALQYVKEQNDQMCMVAVRQNGHALAHVKIQTRDLCIAAVRQTGSAIKYVKRDAVSDVLTEIIDGVAEW